jgi:HlyD family secretion protein
LCVAIALPAAAVRDLATAQPWVLVPERGVAARRDVTVGLRGDTWVEITEGLAEGETVLDDPKRAVGDRVR